MAGRGADLYRFGAPVAGQRQAGIGRAAVAAARQPRRVNKSLPPEAVLEAVRGFTQSKTDKRGAAHEVCARIGPVAE
jgi:hypothetical protein